MNAWPATEQHDSIAEWQDFIKSINSSMVQELHMHRGAAHAQSLGRVGFGSILVPGPLFLNT